MIPSTYFGLLAEFGTAHIPITEIGRKYFGFSELVAKNYATKGGYPFPVFRIGTEKSTWVVDIVDVAAYIDKIKDKAKKEYLLAK